MPSRAAATSPPTSASLVSGIIGLWLALTLIKFGNPVILERQVSAPVRFEEWQIYSWPLSVGYGLLACVLLVTLPFWSWRRVGPAWYVLTPVIWLAWQFVSATQTVDRSLTLATLPHFVACVVAFYLGCFGCRHLSRPAPFWLALVGALVVVLVIGWKQRFGGLEETRRFVFGQTDWQNYPPEFLQKLQSDRIYSTLFYPNALAGVIILLLPISLAVAFHFSKAWSVLARCLSMGVLGCLGLGCLYWSGSKAGWLIVLLQISIWFLQLRVSSRWKGALLAFILIGGLLGFWGKHQGYFAKKATSVSARFDYWAAAWKTLLANPVLGSGPGTFKVPYAALKAPEAEMTRLVHNDFLEQGSDSGLVGLVAYLVWLAGGVTLLYRGSYPQNDHLGMGIRVGLSGIVVQSLVEFGLYVPAIAWPMFFLLGLALMNRANYHIDNHG